MLAQTQICKLGSELISRKRHETIMIIGSNNVVEHTLMRAAQQDKEKDKPSFSVIVVDTCPSFSGRDIAQRLSHCGVHCKYTLI